jgi:hypothetical protein
MSVREKLKKVQAKRAELEEESRLLIEEQKKLEKNVLALEEQVVSRELKKEQAVVDALRSRNKGIKRTVAQLEAEKEELEAKLRQIAQTSEGALEEQTASGSTLKPDKAEEDVEAQEKQKKKKKGRFF